VRADWAQRNFRLGKRREHNWMLKIVALFCGYLFTLLSCAAQEVEGNGKNASALFSNAS
jgi:hypothetical protein